MAVSDKNTCSKDFCQDNPLLLEHLKAVIKQNSKQNLTSITNLDTGKVLHIEDSLAVLPELDKAPVGPMADIGSGAGFPGIPLALVSKRHTTLIESNKKKARFLQSFVEEHKLEALIEIAALRTEEVALATPNAYSVVTARAVAALPSLLELVAPLLAPQGHFVALKSTLDLEEAEKGSQAAKIVGLNQIASRSYTLSTDDIKRTVLVYEKTSEPLKKLPRRPGMATKRPLA